MAKFLFKSNCPICFDEEIHQWTHSDCGGNRYIDENCYLICEKCDNKIFILDTYFTCNNHRNSQKPDVYDIICIIKSIVNIPEMNCKTRKNMLTLLKKYCD